MTYNYEPIPPAREYHRSTKRIRIIVAGARGGKTRATIGADAVTHAIVHDGYWKRDVEDGIPYGIIIAEPTYKQIKLIAWPNFIRALPKGALIDVSLSDRIIWVRGVHGITQVVFTSYEQGSNAIEGLPAIYYAYLDEIFQCPITYYHEVRTRLSERSGRLTCSGTPKPCAWVINDLVLPARNGDPNMFFKSWKTSDNPYFPKEELEFLKRTLPHKIYMRNFEASLDIFHGQIFELNRDVHIKTWDIDQNDYKMIFGGIDWGWTHKGAVVIAGLRDDDCVDILHAVAESELPIISTTGDRDWLSVLRNFQNQYIEKFNIYEAGPDRPENIHALSIKDLYIRPADNEVNGGIEFILTLMNVDENNHSKLRIHGENCKPLIDEIPLYRWKENTAGDLTEKPLMENDDAISAMRYALFSNRHQFRIWNALETIQNEEGSKNENVWV